MTEQFQQRYRPAHRITLSALAVHHIYDEDLADCQPHTDVKLPADVQYIASRSIGDDNRSHRSE